MEWTSFITGDGRTLYYINLGEADTVMIHPLNKVYYVSHLHPDGTLEVVGTGHFLIGAKGIGERHINEREVRVQN